MHLSAPKIGLSPQGPVVLVGNRTTPMRPWNASTESNMQNSRSSREFDNTLPTDGGKASIFRPPITAASDTKETRVDIGDHLLNMATQPISQEDLNNVYNGGETQLVHNHEVGVDDTQLPFAGETQPVNDQGFDDMVVLQNDTLIASTTPLTNGVDAGSLQDSVKVHAFGPIDSAGIKVSSQDDADALGNIPAPYETKASTEETETSVVATGGPPHEKVLVMELPTVTEHPEVQPVITGEQLGLTEASEKDGSTERALVMEVPTMTENPEVQPAATGEQLGLTGSSKKEGFSTPEQQAISHENVASLMEEKLHDRKGKGDEGNLSKYAEAEKDMKDDVTGMAKVLSDQDIQAIKGRKVVKKFGRKNYKGEVVDYDAENQWFKVVYEDGDQEDLELVEVKEILRTEDTSAKMTSAAKRKRSHPEGGDRDDQASKSKKHRKDHTEMPDKKLRTRRKEKGTPKKKGSSHTKKKSLPGKSPRSKSKGLKATKANMKSSELPESSLETECDEILNAFVYEIPVQSQTRSGGKRKRNSDVQAGTSIQEKKTGSKAKGAGRKRIGYAKTSRKSSTKKKGGNSTPKQSFAKRKRTRRRSLLKLPREERKVERVLRVRAGEKQKDTEKSKGKHLKSDASEDQDVFAGKAVKKDFGGILFSGVVTKFNKRTGYYKVKYEDGDQEDLELDELKAVLVQ